MISEGRAGVDDVFSLQNGILKLELGKERYEKTGLTGKPVRSGGRKHVKERFVVEINLRLPSMIHGKKGFERIVWAFKNVLNESVSWLLYGSTLELRSIDQDCPLKQHHPQIVACTPVQTVHHDILIPPFDIRGIEESVSDEDIQDHCNDLSEWLALVSLGSPRVQLTDLVDPYLSRYEVPYRDIARPSTIRSFKWHGILPSQWIMDLLIALL
ncbi:Ribonuclease P [Elaphomyces granulatus]